MSPRALAVVGTDTGVGKTVVTAAVALALRRAGLDPAVVKPVATGGGGCGAAGAVSGDARWLRRVLGLREPAEVVNPICWRAPLAPDEARRQEGAPQGAAGRSHLALRVFGDGRPLLLEGVGGVLVPVIGRITVADLVAELGVPALIVARAGLGTINHTLLTLEALRRRGVAIAGVVLNGARGRDPSERTHSRPGDVAVDSSDSVRPPRAGGPRTPAARCGAGSVAEEVRMTTGGPPLHVHAWVDDGWCFACGAENPHGLKLSFALLDDGGIETSFAAEKTLQGFKNVLHGGMLGLVMDEAMVMLPYRALETVTASAEFTVRLLKPVPIGSRVIVRARFEGRARPRQRVYRVVAEARLEDGTVVASGSGSCVRVR
jgi:dethiobiotin synthetase